MGFIVGEVGFCSSFFINAQRLVKFGQVSDLVITVYHLHDLNVAVILRVSME